MKVEGKTVVFSCVVAGYPEPDVAWKKDGVKLNASGNARLVVSSNDGNHELTVSKVQQSDAGIYRCEANNSLDTATSSPATLTVHCESKSSLSLKHASVNINIGLFRFFFLIVVTFCTLDPSFFQTLPVFGVF